MLSSYIHDPHGSAGDAAAFMSDDRHPASSLGLPIVL